MSTIMAFDFGTKSIGVAVGQTVTGTASPLLGIKARDGIPNWDEIAALLKEWQPDKLVVGLPLNMDGTDQHVTRAARKFANRLFGRFGIETLTQDERLTTVDARARLFEDGGYRALKKDQVDALAAALILESYFETLYQ
ncbi:Holliday junction resolvase YqgF [Ferrimonas balearica DSM 9799]|uniref:Putative pre-16S rRNA nuclease n=1 Tax=Ferrimonas balearica (strain DSM 9799 / CCM 4581 / KCTC 23876 / PAT) TaxID=550540 RepID=E1ST97_FERBD|nr:Holliday junction resolvase RuvX [Ferrimonas balearica]MBY6017634.1 Holliday junction resolvase RuvX [Halomonas denitrificans]ADN77131.1 Holliday junction resolvase YqgF [Ferrimonas balearica DSM 9799]MBW3139874.1 Holliday junction resolvase RuvX [Ferrimonas balearica]MBW3164896.1 Holliday junction resolvase RuvX [Ferrimonas balearica]MBY5980237.1 Holliday junction resolvase RuvX [Ferrimonas balearica]